MYGAVNHHDLHPCLSQRRKRRRKPTGSIVIGPHVVLDVDNRLVLEALKINQQVGSRQPSGSSSNSCNRGCSSGESRSSHVESISPIEIRSSKCTWSFLRNDVSFIVTKRSKGNVRASSIHSNWSISGTASEYSSRTFFPANTTRTASRALASGPSSPKGRHRNT